MSETETKTTTAERPPSVETVPLSEARFLEVIRGEDGQDELELSRRIQDEEESLNDKLAKMAEGMKLLEARSAMQERAHMLALRRTEPEHWVLFKDKQGNVNAMLTSPGAPLVAEVYGIQIVNPRPLDKAGNFDPEKIEGGALGYGYRCWGDGISHLTGRRVVAVEAFRASTEDFIGRAAMRSTPDIVKDADLRNSCFTLLSTKIVRILGNCTRVPPGMLTRAWEGTGKSTDACRKGSGFGGSDERTAQAVADPNAKEGAEGLWNEIIRRTGGDVDAGKKLLLEITANPDRNFTGFDSWQRLTQEWQIERAFKNLRGHRVFGDQQGVQKKAR